MQIRRGVETREQSKFHIISETHILELFWTLFVKFLGELNFLGNIVAIQNLLDLQSPLSLISCCFSPLQPFFGHVM